MADERRQSDVKWRDELTERVDHIDGRLATVEQGLKTNTTITQQIADDTSWLRGVLNDGAGAIRFLCRVAKWWRFGVRYVLLPIGGLIVVPYLIVYWFTHNYTLPLWAARLVELFWK